MTTKTARYAPDLKTLLALGVLLVAGAAVATTARAQAYTDAELEELVAPIALYPDDVLGVILPASTFPLDIVRAARFLEEVEDDPGLEPDETWDDSVVALLNYPEVVDMMNEDLDWTWALGEAVLTDQAAVLDAAQDFRALAYEAGNLRSDEKQIVGYSDGAIRIKPANPEVVYIPVYEPREVIVYQPAPVYRYYPVAYPVYYYPYPVGYRFGIDYFWGVTSYFSVGWHSHYVHVHHHTHRLHPYYLNSYYSYTPYYPRSSVNITVVVDNHRDVWLPNPRRGSRPRTATVESRSGTRSASSRSVETQPNLATRSTTASQRSATSERSTSTLGRVTERPTARSDRPSARADTVLPDKTRSVESPAVTSSQTRSIRTREPDATTVTPPSAQSRTRIETAAPQSTSRSSTSRSTFTPQGSSTRSTVTPQGSSTRSTVTSRSSTSQRTQAPAPSVNQRSTVTTRSQPSTNSSPRSQGTTTRSNAARSSSAPRTRER
jgi:hypothetical protein